MPGVRVPVVRGWMVATPDGGGTVFAFTQWGRNRTKWLWVRLFDGREKAYRPRQVKQIDALTGNRIRRGEMQFTYEVELDYGDEPEEWDEPTPTGEDIAIAVRRGLEQMGFSSMDVSARAQNEEAFSRGNG